MDIVVNEDLKAYIDPLTPDEEEALERSLLAEGCRDALVLWGNVLVDGHNRHRLCTKHGIPFRTVQNPRFKSLEDVHLWMIDQHLGRRSVSDFQRGVLALRKREIVAERRARVAAVESGAVETVAAPAVQAAADAVASADMASDVAAAPVAPAAALPPQDSLETREALARAARLSSSQVVLIEKIQKQGAPELVAAVRAGTVSINAAAAVASLPVEEQAAAAAAGAEELKQAAKRVRESRRRAPPAEVAATDEASAAPAAPEAGDALPSIDALRQRVADLEAENALLRAELAGLRAAGGGEGVSGGGGAPF
ncbi:plasmid replication/partition related protein [Roseateles sp. BYS87W]|uniref:Plasmid replication/partition related protein n=1 Tax=Pelomonas baiyunensis TaxID=3299026 RepID=A0ABW7GW99_9BURK